MKDMLLEKLLRLFEECFQKRQTEATQPADYAVSDIKAEVWGQLPSLEKNTLFIKTARPTSKRVLSQAEQLKLTDRGLRFLLHIMQLDLIGERTLELIIDQITFYPDEVVSTPILQTIIRQTLFDSLTLNQWAFLEMVLVGDGPFVTRH